ncbi:MAG: response regulator [Oscillatoriales cyanobacterium RU_3_3]|nr:response regulator [Oscillatoriales cyanobacterium RU_3_3]NJR25111.1 response regulator [Richelia sp. CSU_2_1]
MKVFPGKQRILCVDDSLDNSELLSFILDDAGYEVETAQSMTEGLQLARKGKFKLYLVDLCLSDGSGFDLIEQIREFDRSTPIGVCSAYVRESVQEEAMRAGVQVFFSKPIDPDLFAETIAKIIASYEEIGTYTE